MNAPSMNPSNSLNIQLLKFPSLPKAPISAKVNGRGIRWNLSHGWAGNTPHSPVEAERFTSDKIETLTLIPYGCTNLRITEFPTV